MKETLKIFYIFLIVFSTIFAQQTETIYLSGQDADAPVKWDFMVSKGMNANKWSKINVPSNWELQGFGNYNYGLDKNKSDGVGYYKYKFRVLTSWLGKQINIVFEGVMTDTEVKINGKFAGTIHQGGFYRFEYDITELLKYGEENLLEVTVHKVSSNKSIELAERKADYWVFGGIYRPVYLNIYPWEHIVRTAIDAKANGHFRINVFLENIKAADKIEVNIKKNKKIISTLTKELYHGQKAVALKGYVKKHKNWTSETPNLYTAEVLILKSEKIIHKISNSFGFRTVEIKEHKGLYINNIKVILKGINRHTFSPELGRAFSKKQCDEDVKLIKEMNINAVRMSHYPPDSYFLYLCDKYGIYVLDEVAGWQKPSYDTPASKRIIKETVIRDVNHPSVIFWDNGNEGGWNFETDGEFEKYDPQKRAVLHPWELFGGIDTEHYEDYKNVEKKLKSRNIFMPTEHLHGLYDGGLGAGLDDFWNLMWGKPLTGGMFLWDFADEGVVRTDNNNIIDTDGNHAPDGIVGPYREKEASFFTVKEIWSPIYIETNNKLNKKFNGIIPIENRYDFTNLNKCSFEWKLIKYTSPENYKLKNAIIAHGNLIGPDISPKHKGRLVLNLPASLKIADALCLTAFDNHNKEIFTWKWKLIENSKIVEDIFQSGKTAPNLFENDTTIMVSSDKFSYTFDKKNGILKSIKTGAQEYSFNKGPLFVTDVTQSNIINNKKIRIEISESKNAKIIDVKNNPGFDKLTWTIYGSGWLKLKYTYSIYDSVEYMGVSFNYPEKKVKSKKWLGKGPYRVWKNRLKGQTIDVWQSNYKNFKLNTKWDYPVSAGYFADFSWLVLDTEEGKITILTANNNLYLRLFSQKNRDEPRHTKMIWPEGDISFLHAIPAIGTKFHKAEKLGPQSKKFSANGAYSATLYLYFGARR